MEILIYSRIENSQKDTFLKKISQVCNIMPVMVFEFKALFKLMKLRKRADQLIVFFISSHRELDFLDSNRGYLSNTRYIIILPNDEEAMVSRALSLYPRYLSYSHHNFEDVCAVLNKMTENINLR